MVRFKPEVRIGFVDARLICILQMAAAWSYRSRVEVEVNSIEDGSAVHMAGSLHSVGLAIDLDTVGDKTDDLMALAEYARRWMEPQFDVVLEGDHVHVEWDAHRGPLVKKVTT